MIISKVSVPKGEDINSLMQSHVGGAAGNPDRSIGEAGILRHLLDSRELIFSTEKSTIEKRKTESKPMASKEKGKLDSSNPSLLAYGIGPLLFSLIGGVSGSNLERLRVTLKVERPGMASGKLRHSFDLYNDDQLERYARKAADRLDIGSQEMRQALHSLVDEVEQYRMAAINIKKGAQKVVLSESRKSKAVDYLSTPYLLKRTNEDIEKTGVVGERINRLLMYLCFTSRLRATPLHVITMGGSGTGKTYLQEKIGDLMPDESVIQCTASTDNAFYYIRNGDLRNRLVLIEDLDGAEGVMYILRELMSKKWVSKLVVNKDPSGKLETMRVEVFGPISLAATTTRERLYEDNANRSILIYPDNSAGHQEAIMEQQRKLSAGLIHEGEQERIRSFFKDVQRVLRVVKVRNPYAEQLRIPSECFKPLRTHAHYLHFIETVTFYHQYQRALKTCQVSGEKYIETTLEDIEASNALLKEVLLAKSDELSGACRSFEAKLRKWLGERKKESFYARDVRTSMRMHPSKLKRYVSELLMYGCLKQIGGSRHKGYEYELLEKAAYEELSTRIKTVLDEILDKIKGKK